MEWSKDAKDTLAALERLAATCGFCDGPAAPAAEWPKGTDVRIRIAASTYKPCCERCYYESGDGYFCVECNAFIYFANLIDPDDPEELYTCIWCASEKCESE